MANDDIKETAKKNKKLLRRLDGARASYAKAEKRVARLRARLSRAEATLARRAARLAAMTDSVSARADDKMEQEPATPQAAADAGEAVVQTHGEAAGDVAVVTAGEAATSLGQADALAAVAQPPENGIKPARSRRKAAKTDEA